LCMSCVKIFVEGRGAEGLERDCSFALDI